VGRPPLRSFICAQSPAILEYAPVPFVLRDRAKNFARAIFVKHSTSSTPPDNIPLSDHLFFRMARFAVLQHDTLFFRHPFRFNRILFPPCAPLELLPFLFESLTPPAFDVIVPTFYHPHFLPISISHPVSLVLFKLRLTPWSAIFLPYSSCVYECDNGNRLSFPTPMHLTNS